MMIVYTTIEGQSENGRNDFPQYGGMIIDYIPTLHVAAVNLHY